MAHFSLNQYLQQVESAWCIKDGKSFSDLVSLSDAHIASCRLNLENPEEFVERGLSAPIDEVISTHLRCVWQINNRNFQEAFSCQSVLLQVVSRILQNQKDENWFLPVMYCVCIDLRLVALYADRQIVYKDVLKPFEMLEKCAEQLMTCFRICAADNRAADKFTKRWGMLTLVNQLFKVYFKINKLNLCRPLIRAIESCSISHKFQLSQQITYQYYVGRKAIYDYDFEEANYCLTFAFEKCYKGSRRNKQLILRYLIPIRMLLGFVPNKKTLEKYDLAIFWNIIIAVKQGNVFQMNSVINSNLPFFVQSGIYLLVLKLQYIAQRNIVKQVFSFLNVFQIPLETIQLALSFSHREQLSIEETECILANLINDGKLKGYISSQHKKLVLSKQDPFPPLRIKDKGSESVKSRPFEKKLKRMDF